MAYNTIEDSPPEEALKDQHELMEQDTMEQNAPQPKVLRWNFPLMGEVYIKMLQKFVSSNSETQLQETCAKVSSFAGFFVFSHYKQSFSSIMNVQYSTLDKSSEVLKLQFKIGNIEETKTFTYKHII